MKVLVVVPCNQKQQQCLKFQINQVEAGLQIQAQLVVQTLSRSPFSPMEALQLPHLLASQTILHYYVTKIIHQIELHEMICLTFKGRIVIIIYHIFDWTCRCCQLQTERNLWPKKKKKNMFQSSNKGFKTNSNLTDTVVLIINYLSKSFVNYQILNKTT